MPGTATLTRVPSRKRNSRGRKAQRQGVSGNPQRRAQQLQARRVVRDLPAFREVAYRLAGGAPAEAWWRESHERILVRARALAWPSSLVGRETQACQIVGDEFYDRLQSPDTGLHPAQWLRTLAEETGAALRAALAQGADDWQKIWAFMYGLALATPRMSAGTVDETARSFLQEFPDIKDPRETVLAEVERAAKSLARHGLTPAVLYPVGGPRPAGEPLAARDVYGSRFLLMAPFSYDDDAPDHWYAWDIDLCWIDAVVGAGVFASAGDALREWHEAVGPSASGAVASPCAAGMAAQLLASCLRTGPMADMLEGSEPRDLIREYYRLRRRAQDLVGSADVGVGSAASDDGREQDAFVNWYAERHDDAQKTAADATGIILAEWGPGQSLDQRLFYACSPHRIEMTARLIRDGYFAEDANLALRLLPEWTEWCIEQSRLDDGAAARSRAAAYAAASALVDEEDDNPAVMDDGVPFRRHE